MDLTQYLYRPSETKCLNYRLFHGRGLAIEEPWKQVCIDYFDGHVILIAYKELSKGEIKSLCEQLQQYLGMRLKSIRLQKRYLKANVKNEFLQGNNVNETVFAEEDGCRFYLNLSQFQNPGFFLDMKPGRDLCANLAKGKRVLNLFAYTCSFSVRAVKAGALSACNVDMKESFLNIGRKNHQLNNCDMRSVSFMKCNVLKSVNKIAKQGPFDLIITDPPSAQKGSFECERDYPKLIRRINEWCRPGAKIMACLNAPWLDKQFLLNTFEEYQPQMKLLTEVEQAKDFPERDSAQGLKVLVFEYQV